MRNKAKNDNPKKGVICLPVQYYMMLINKLLEYGKANEIIPRDLMDCYRICEEASEKMKELNVNQRKRASFKHNCKKKCDKYGKPSITAYLYLITISNK